MSRAAVLLLILLCLASAVAAPPENFDQRVESLRNSLGVPGVSIAIVENGRTVLAKGYGIRVYNPSGTEIAALPTPIRPTNVTLATRNGKTTLYVTAGSTLYRIATTVPARQ